MRRRSTIAAVVTVAAALSAVPAAGVADTEDSRASAAPAAWRLKPIGIGPLRLGMTERQALEVVPDLRVEREQFCDYWTVPGLEGVGLRVTHEGGALTSVSIGPATPAGHGARGVEIGDRRRELKRKFGRRLKVVKRSPELGRDFYRVDARPGRQRALEFTVDRRTKRVTFEEAGVSGSFYYTDGVELCG